MPFLLNFFIVFFIPVYWSCVVVIFNTFYTSGCVMKLFWVIKKSVYNISSCFVRWCWGNLYALVLRDRCGYFAELYRSNFIFTSFSPDFDCYFRPFLIHNNNRFLALFKFIFTLFSSLSFNILHFLFLPVCLGRV